MPELTPEDSLRLNVLLAGDIHAVRIDSNTMTLYGLTPKGTATVKLHPPGRNDQYLRSVRELLASYALGSPGGYPVYLQRWTRMGQARDRGLDKMLLLGEPEAVTSVAYSSGLTDELARRAWWAMPVPDHARRMLERECVIQGSMGKVLADYLVDYLPFETSAQLIIETIRILLQPGLINDDTRLSLWRKGVGNNAYHVGFLDKQPDELPEQHKARAELAQHETTLATLAALGNVYAQFLHRILSGHGQTFFHFYDEVLRYPADKDVVLVLLNALDNYFTALRQLHPCSGTTMEEVIATTENYMADPQKDSALAELMQAVPELKAEIRAMLALSCVDVDMATPIMSQTTASGTLMRKKLEPVSLPMMQLNAVVMGKEFSASTTRRRPRGQ